MWTCLFFPSDKDGDKGFPGILCGHVYIPPQIKMAAKVFPGILCGRVYIPPQIKMAAKVFLETFVNVFTQTEGTLRLRKLSRILTDARIKGFLSL